MTTEVVSPSLAAPQPMPQVPDACVGSVVHVVKQAHLTWCWAAAGLCLLDHFDRNVKNLDQCGVVRQLPGTCPAPCQSPACLATKAIEDVFLALGLTPRSYVLDKTLEQPLGQGAVVVSEVTSGTDSHLVVIHQFCPASNLILMMDPKQDWDTHKGDLGLFLRRETRSFLLTKADNPPQTQVKAFAASLLQSPMKAAVGKARHRTPPQRLRLSPDRALAVPRPPRPAKLLGDTLHRFHAAGVADSTPKTDIWFPRLCWSFQDLHAGNLDAAVFLGWREVLEKNGPTEVVDAVSVGDAPVIEKRSTGDAVQGIADALDEVTRRGIDLQAVTMLAVPCLALHMLRYKDQQGTPKLLTAFSIWPEFQGEMDVADFVQKAQARAATERVTSNV
jgi:hypothetical protein